MNCPDLLQFHLSSEKDNRFAEEVSIRRKIDNAVDLTLLSQGEEAGCKKGHGAGKRGFT